MPTFGDVIENGWASQDNPKRYGFFVRQGCRRGKMNPGPFYVLTDGWGKFWDVSAGSNSKLTVAKMSRVFDQ